MRALVFDIETFPIEAFVWGIWETNVALNQIKQDWTVASYAAKWLESKKVFYADQRYAKNIRDDKQLLKGIWELLDQADVVITQNGKSFDVKKLNARFVINGFQPTSNFKHIDTKILAKKHFGFTSNRLEYMTEKLCTKYKKLQHKNFPGQDLWTECLKGNLKAWKEMEKYNKHDVLATEELYKKLIPYDSANFNVFNVSKEFICTCGSRELRNKGYHYTLVGRYARYKCKKCGKPWRDRTNLLSKDKLKSLKVGAAG